MATRLIPPAVVMATATLTNTGDDAVDAIMAQALLGHKPLVGSWDPDYTGDWQAQAGGPLGPGQSMQISARVSVPASASSSGGKLGRLAVKGTGVQTGKEASVSSTSSASVFDIIILTKLTGTLTGLQLNLTSMRAGETRLVTIQAVLSNTSPVALADILMEASFLGGGRAHPGTATGNGELAAGASKTVASSVTVVGSQAGSLDLRVLLSASGVGTTLQLQIEEIQGGALRIEAPLQSGVGLGGIDWSLV